MNLHQYLNFPRRNENKFSKMRKLDQDVAKKLRFYFLARWSNSGAEYAVLIPDKNSDSTHSKRLHSPAGYALEIC